MKDVFRTGRAGANATAPVGAIFEPAESLLDRAFKNVQRLRAETAHDPDIAAASAELRAAAAAEASPSGECPNCGADCEQPLECSACGEECCSECAPNGICDKCRAEDEDPAATAPAGNLPPASSAMASHPAPAAVIPAAAAPMAVSPPAPVQDRAFFVQLERTGGLSNLDLWKVGEALNAIDRGETPEPWLGQKARDEQSNALQLLLESEQSNNESWRITEHLQKLWAGENPGEFIPGSVIKERLATATAALEAETDPKEINRLVSQFDAISKGAPFVSKEAAAAKRSALVARLQASNSNKERWDLTEEIAAL